jgi:hypothetical protein
MNKKGKVCTTIEYPHENGPIDLWKQLIEETMFLQYYLHMSRSECLRLPVHERKYLVERLIGQIFKSHRSHIREDAYLMWLEEGCPEGQHLDHWNKAQKTYEGIN